MARFAPYPCPVCTIVDVPRYSIVAGTQEVYKISLDTLAVLWDQISRAKLAIHQDTGTQPVLRPNLQRIVGPPIVVVRVNHLEA